MLRRGRVYAPAMCGTGNFIDCVDHWAIASLRISTMSVPGILLLHESHIRGTKCSCWLRPFLFGIMNIPIWSVSKVQPPLVFFIVFIDWLIRLSVSSRARFHSLRRFIRHPWSSLWRRQVLSAQSRCVLADTEGYGWGDYGSGILFCWSVWGWTRRTWHPLERVSCTIMWTRNDYSTGFVQHDSTVTLCCQCAWLLKVLQYCIEWHCRHGASRTTEA